MYRLAEIPEGKSYLIEKVELSDSRDELQLAALGIAPKATIAKVCSAPFKDPIEYVLDRVQLVALARRIAEQIWVSELPGV